MDVTAAEGGDWSYNATPAELSDKKEYFFGSLDPYRYIIQDDVDIPLTPGSGNAAGSSLRVCAHPKGSL